MRVMRILLCLFLFSFVCVGQTIEERVKKFEDSKFYSVTYDKFRKQTKIIYDFKTPALDPKTPLRKYLDMAVFLIIPDNEKPFIGLYFGPQGILYNDSTLRLRLDGQAVEMDVDDYDYSTTVDVTQQFKMIANSKNVEFQLGLFEGKLDAKQLKAFQNLANIVTFPK